MSLSDLPALPLPNACTPHLSAGCGSSASNHGVAHRFMNQAAPEDRSSSLFTRILMSCPSFSSFLCPRFTPLRDREISLHALSHLFQKEFS